MHFQPGAAKPAANISSLLAISSSSFPPKITNISYFNKISSQHDNDFQYGEWVACLRYWVKIRKHWCWSIRMMNYVYRYTQWQRKIPIWNRNHYNHDRNCPLFEVFSPLKCTKIPQNFACGGPKSPKMSSQELMNQELMEISSLPNQARGIPEHEH